MVSRSVTLAAAVPLQRQQIAASEGRSNDMDGEDGELRRQEIAFPAQKRLQRRTWGLLWMIRLSVEASQSCVVFKFVCGA